MKPFIVLLILAIAPFVHAATTPAASPATTNNDDSCDIGVFPAATLLLPHFEVDLDAPASTAATTLFTIVNTTRVPQIANVTLWTDWAYPVLNFDIFLTGYDVQAINLYDVLARGLVAPPNNTSNATTPGARSLANNANPNFGQSAQAFCSNTAQGSGVIPASLLADVRAAFTVGVLPVCPGDRIGGTHVTAIGYVTVDVVSTCKPTFQTEASYFGEILYDNVLTGDYQQLNPNPVTGNYASGNPLVHIRAVPEGGSAGAEVTTGLPYTFYDRYTPAAARRLDRRQPLPSTFATRFIDGGTSSFNTVFDLWREGLTGANASCDAYITNAVMPFATVVRFDERENPSAFSSPSPFPGPSGITTNAANRLPSNSSRFPPNVGNVAGWFYLNLNNGGSTAYSAEAGRDFTTNSSTKIGPRQSQNWVTWTMSAEGRFSASMDATQLGNGCSRSPADPIIQDAASPPIGPLPNVTP